MSGDPRRKRTDRFVMIVTAVITALLISSLVYCYFALDLSTVSSICSIRRMTGQHIHSGSFAGSLFEFFESPLKQLI